MSVELLGKINQIHTTPLGVKRIKRNLQIDVDDVVSYCKNLILDKDAIIERKGKNWYVISQNKIITINAHSYTIITAHMKKCK